MTWAFQFQNPWFNFIISCIVVVFALNLFGVFEIVLPGRASTAFAEASSQEGYAGSFFQGSFCDVACYSLHRAVSWDRAWLCIQPVRLVILAMFSSVALGMSAPYFFLSARPGWMKLLPKPGAWMERVKQFMGFPLLATLLWLLYILGNQRGLERRHRDRRLFCFVLRWRAGFTAHFADRSRLRKARVVSLVVMLLLVLFGGRFFLPGIFSLTHQPPVRRRRPDEGIAWKPFSQKELDDLLKAGNAVFVDFTADWCISCKFNERTAIDVPAVREAFARDGIVPMKADWTNANPEITAALKKFGRVGVPFYVLYPRGKPDQPIILPEILTEKIVLEALSKAHS